VSAEGAAIRDQVRLLLMHRRPVGQQRAFLEACKPGETFYLPQTLRQQLHEGSIARYRLRRFEYLAWLAVK
jgi:hypothetical protein